MQWADALVGAFTEPVVVTDAALHVLAWTPAAQAMAAGGDPRVGRPVRESFAFFGHSAAVDALHDAIARRKTRVVEWRVPRTDVELWLEARATPWRDASGQIVGLVVFLADITARRREAGFAAALATVGQALSSSLDLNEVLDTVAARTLEVMGGDAAVVVGWDGEAPVYQVLRATGRLSREYIAAGSIAVGGGPIALAVKEKRPVTTPNILTDPAIWLTEERRSEIEQEGFRAVASAPLAAKGRVHGALVVHYWRERQFSDDEVMALSRLAAQAAVAIDNARLYGEATRRAARLRELADVEALVTAPLDLADVLQRIAAATARMLGVPLAQIWVASGEAREMERRAVSTDLAIAEEVLPPALAADDALVAALARTRASVDVTDVTADARTASMHWAAGFGLHALFAAPIMSGDELLGVLTLHGRDGWRPGEEERALLVALVARIALAVRSVREYGEAVQRATRLGELVAVTRSISASLDPAAVMQAIADAAGALSPGALATMHIYDRDHDRLRAFAVSGEEARRFPVERAADFGLPGVVTTTRRPVVVSDPVNHPATAVRDWWRRHPGATYCGVPILVGDTFVGVLDFIVPGRVASREEQELLQLLAAHAGIAIQNASRYDNERRQGERVLALAEVNRRISSALELDELLEAIAQSAANLTGVRFASFWTADEQRQTVTFHRGSDPAIAATMPQAMFPYDQGGVGWVARHRAAFIVDDLATDPRIVHKEWFAQQSLRAFAAYPVISGSDLVAVLLLSDSQPLRFAPDTQGMIELFTAQAAVAIQNARLYREAKRRRDMAEALALLGRELTETLDVVRIEDIVTRGVVALLGVRGGAVHRYSPADGTLTATTSFGLDADAVRGLVLQPGEGGAGLAVQERCLVASADLLQDSRITLAREARERIRAYPFRAIMAAPLLARDRVLGALAVGADAGRDFTADERQVFQAFADQTALALENARLYGESERERREASTLATAARQLAASLDVDELAGQLVEVVRELFSTHASALYRVREDGMLVSVGFGGAARAHMRAGEVVERRDGLASRAVEERRPVWTRDVLHDPGVHLSDAFRAAIVASGNRAVLAVPLIVKNDVVGVLAISDSVPRDFEAREVDLLQAFADQAALALENARLYASARESLARLRDTQAQLVQAAKMSALGQLVSGVAHELNNPLSVVIGYGQLLLGRDLPPALKRPVELMVSQGDRMAKIVRNLLFFARQRPPERIPARINQVIDETLALRLNQLTLSGIAVERQFADELPTIAADAQQLQQVFLNLLLNAEQAILETGRAGRIVVRSSLMDGGRGGVRAEVIDDGPGITPDVLPHVFEPFYTTKEVGTGTGLGLSVSYGIVQEHGGRLFVESRPGHTVFTVELPVLAEVPSRRPVAPVALGSMAGQGRAALVVEDEPHVSDLIVTMLGDTGWRVDVATGGRGGLERIHARRYDLIVSDMRMPDGDGAELYRAALVHDAALAQRFIFLTGDTANTTAWQFLKQTRAPVLEKPFAPAVFLDAVRRLTAALTPETSSA